MIKMTFPDVELGDPENCKSWLYIGILINSRRVLVLS